MRCLSICEALSSLLLVCWMQSDAMGPSCAGQCGSWAGSDRDWCYCKDSCKEFGDCCSDYDAACKHLSCQGNCGSRVGTDSNWCSCSESCSRDGSCCSDFAVFCPGSSCPKCPNDKYNCDDYAEYGYTCEELESRWGCDCTGCSTECRPTLPLAKLVSLDESKYPDARCLDGSIAGYYLRQGTVNKYIIHLEGGGWCYDQNCDHITQEGTLQDCRKRMQTKKGSSNHWKKTMGEEDLSGMLSADLEKNPAFHDWTLVYLPNCDGTSFSGDAVVEGIYFHGHAILESAVAEIRTTTNIDAAEQVVISGGSAGATGVLYHGDKLAALLGTGKVSALSDAGFFLDLPDKDGVDCWPAQMRSIFSISNGYSSLHVGCLARFPDESWKCLFPEYYSDLILTRSMVLQSFYDTSEISYTLRLSSECPDGWRCSWKEKQVYKNMRSQHMKAWSALVSKPGNGVWAIACPIHTMTWKSWMDAKWEVPEASGNTMAAVVKRWLAHDDLDGKEFVYQDEDWPLNDECLRSWSYREALFM